MTNPPIVPVLIALAPEYGDMGLDEWGAWRSIRCVFHGERHASASYNADEGVYVCHTCGLKGDAYELVKEVEGVDFPTAKRRVAEITGSSGNQVSGTSVGRFGGGGRSRLPQRKGTSGERRQRLSSRTRRGR